MNRLRSAIEPLWLRRFGGCGRSGALGFTLRRELSEQLRELLLKRLELGQDLILALFDLVNGRRIRGEIGHDVELSFTGRCGFLEIASADRRPEIDSKFDLGCLRRLCRQRVARSPGAKSSAAGLRGSQFVDFAAWRL